MKFTKECLKRSVRTFLQAAVAYLCVHLMVIDFSDQSESLKQVFIGLAVSTVAAGLSAVMNLEKKGGCSEDDNG
jgi:hypothetical protein